MRRNYETVREGVADVMYGKVLNYEAKNILNRGKAEGLSLGLSQGRIEGNEERTRIFISNMLKRNMSDADICALAECSQEMVDEERKSLR